MRVARGVRERAGEQAASPPREAREAARAAVGEGNGRRKAREKKGRGPIVLLGACSLVCLAVFFTEVVWFFPLLPFSLDISGRTRLPETPPGQVRILFVGDVLLGDAGHGVLGRRGYDHPFGTTRQILGGADLAVGNQEGPISASAPRDEGKRWSYRADPRSAKALARAGLGLMSLANNHVRDCGDQGVRDTVRHLREAGVTPFGAGASPEEAHEPALVTVRGLRLAIFGYLAAEQRYRGQLVSHAALAARPGQAGVALGAIPAVQRDLARLKAKGGADLRIAVLHQGDRYHREPSALERKIARDMIEAGFDVVVVHGTHLAGPVELHQGKPILHGLGNFAFLSGNVRAGFSLMAALDLDLARRRPSRLQLLPIYTVNRNPWVWFQTRVILGRPARTRLGELARRSVGYGAYLRLRQGPTRLVAEL
ncbi:MAG: CapA family protein [Polyangia bacterium]|nr:CapA family protein [Polyangia bacterium]